MKIKQKEELRAREASNALYGLKCMSSDCVGKYSTLIKSPDFTRPD